MDKKNLDIINSYQKEIILLNQINSLLNWDQQTYMPSQGLESRAEEISVISSLIHKKLISDEFFIAINELKNEKLDKKNKRLIEKLYKEISKAKKIPEKFIKESSKTTTLSFQAWQNARIKNDFKIFRPWLEKVVELKKKQADYLQLYPSAYDTLIDEFDEGMTVEKLKPFFQDLKKGILEVLKKITNSKLYKTQEISLLKKEFPKDIQIEFAKDVVKRIGLKEEFSRIDFAEHPFSTRIGFKDVRITTNVRDTPLFSFFSTIHEAGHALYDLNNSNSKYSFLNEAPSYGLHESQSRFWELLIGLNKSFWKFYFPIFNEKFNLQSDIDQWYREINYIKPSLIRIESDEINYCLHIIIRYEIEAGLLDGSIEVKDLPKIWNQKMKEYFGLEPMTDKEGVLQDVHWSQGYFGYFPSYAIGTIYSAQLYNQLKKEIPIIEDIIAKGDFSKITGWLNDNVHKKGSTMIADDLIKEVTGERLNPKIFLDYLDKKYGEIYGFW